MEATIVIVPRQPNMRKPAMSTEPIKSPCKRLCAVDGRLGFCRGCGRTLKEIGGWSKYSHAERDVIMDELAGRFANKGLTVPE